MDVLGHQNVRMKRNVNVFETMSEICRCEASDQCNNPESSNADQFDEPAESGIVVYFYLYKVTELFLTRQVRI